jgi:hypothetical protein
MTEKHLKPGAVVPVRKQYEMDVRYWTFTVVNETGAVYFPEAESYKRAHEAKAAMRAYVKAFNAIHKEDDDD